MFKRRVLNLSHLDLKFTSNFDIRISELFDIWYHASWRISLPRRTGSPTRLACNLEFILDIAALFVKI